MDWRARRNYSYRDSRQPRTERVTCPGLNLKHRISPICKDNFYFVILLYTAWELKTVFLRSSSVFFFNALSTLGWAWSGPCCYYSIWGNFCHCYKPCASHRPRAKTIWQSIYKNNGNSIYHYNTNIHCDDKSFAKLLSNKTYFRSLSEGFKPWRNYLNHQEIT